MPSTRDSEEPERDILIHAHEQDQRAARVRSLSALHGAHLRRSRSVWSVRQTTRTSPSHDGAIYDGHARRGLLSRRRRPRAGDIAFVGRLDGASGPYDHLRGVAVLQLTPVHLIVGRDAGIRAVGDLRGRRIGVGPPGSGTALTAELILRAFGIGPSAVHTEALPFNEAARRIVDGTLDAMFDNAIW